MKKTYIAPKAICVNLGMEESYLLGTSSDTPAEQSLGMDTKGQSMWSFGGDQDITSSNAWSDDEDW